VHCGDKVTRIVYPGLLILSLDMQEAWDYLGARAAGANYPFPGCLCPREELHKLKCLHPRRTTEMMRAAYEAAQDPDLSRTAKEKHLRSFGMHDKRVSEWIMDVKASH
jgi:hypothetical protein